MDIITLDFETYYGDDYTLSKMTTEAYIRDPRFEPLICGVKVNERLPSRAIGRPHIQLLLDSLDIENNAVLCHHAHFDGLILSHHFGHKPKAWFDTLSMSRALHGTEVGGSLAKLMAHFGVGEKGTEVIHAKGKRLADFSQQDILLYAIYCMNDVQGTYDIFNCMLDGFPKKELKIIDMVVRMFTEPALYLDEEMLREYAQDLQANKLTMLCEAGVTLDEVMSNDKFAAALQRAGIEPPKKVSPATGKSAWAFAKTDKAFTDLQEHPLEQVQALMAARLGNKSTINETRALRMVDMAPRGQAPIYLKYSGAQQTHRLSGGDKMNWQNMERGGTLRNSIYVGENEEIVVIDSSNIEARVLDWLAMQEDAIEVYRAYDRGEGPDIYCVMGEKIYQRPIVKGVDKLERQVGKTAKLQLGYQSGGPRFQEAVRIESIKAKNPITIALSTAEKIVEVYRTNHPMVVGLWARGKDALTSLMSGPDGEKYLDPHNLLLIEKGAILLPNGLRIRYPELQFDRNSASFGGWSFRSNRGERTNLYGGKVVENVVQALARNIVLEQTLEIHKHTPCRMSVHDEGVFVVPKGAGQEWLDYGISVMSQPPSWAPDLPLAADGGVANRYGEAKK